eukprot:TRINITY_DN6248_c0_g1_i1.p1 TRINITY_DN6248_c0_g1~~TRINITY_DN6248_c0_g1_i1.p1  ORF type:complete len:201 (+),score=28.24 TRINITY_DN6248_c0_g1_i1:218-820(+)
MFGLRKKMGLATTPPRRSASKSSQKNLDALLEKYRAGSVHRCWYDPPSLRVVLRRSLPSTFYFVLGVLSIVAAAVLIFLECYLIRRPSRRNPLLDARFISFSAPRIIPIIDVVAFTRENLNAFWRPLTAEERGCSAAADDCAICLGPLFPPAGDLEEQPAEVVALKECHHHFFHHKCITPCVTEDAKLRCPLCKHEYSLH